MTSIRSPGCSQTGGCAREPHAAGGARRDDVARAQGREGREELDRPRDVEDHLRGPRRLHDLAVEPGRQRDVGDVDLVGRHELGPDRHRAVEVLARGPLARRALPFACGGVVDDDVPGDRRERVVGGDVATAAPDHEAELALEIESRAQLRLDEVAVGGADGVGAADERLGPRRRRPAALERVLEVVDAEAEDPVRRRDRGAELRLADLAPRLAGGHPHQLERLDAAVEYAGEVRQPRVAGRLRDVDIARAAAHVQPQTLGRDDRR